MAGRGTRKSGAASKPQPTVRDVSDTISIVEVLRDVGFDTPAAQKRARAVLESAGLTRAGKTGIAPYKRDAAEALLAQNLARVCSRACAALMTGGRAPVVTGGTACEVCGGSNNRRAAIAASRDLRASSVRRVLVVGGTTQQHREVAQLLLGVELQFVDGTRASHSQKEAVANMAWAEMVIIWGPTPLRHAVSNLYTSEPPPHLRVITVHRRSIEALCMEVSRNCAPRSARQRA
jgi:hypothetical protein